MCTFLAQPLAGAWSEIWSLLCVKIHVNIKRDTVSLTADLLLSMNVCK